MGGEAVLLAVIDGVGHYRGGDVAAALARDTILRHLDGYGQASAEAGLEKALTEAGNRIRKAAEKSGEHSQMGCVATACVIDEEGRLTYAHQGDCRLYVYQDGLLRKITHDDAPVGELEEQGLLTEEEAMCHPDRNIIYDMLGAGLHEASDGFIEHGTLHLGGNCQVLLCSDGLTDQVGSGEIKAVLDEDVSCTAKADLLVGAANGKGGKDNVTVVVATVDAPKRREDPPKQTPIQSETDNKNNVKRMKKNKTVIPVMTIVTLGLLAGFLVLFNNQKPMLDAAREAYAGRTAVNLDEDTPEGILTLILRDGGFYPDGRDAECVSHHLATARHKNGRPFRRLGELTGWQNQMPVSTARNRGGEALAALADSSCRRLGQTPEIAAMYGKDSVPPFPRTGDAVIEVRVARAGDGAPVPGVIVRVKEHFYEERTDTSGALAAVSPRDSVVGYMRTDDLGRVRIPATRGRSYSVLPVRPGFEYGSEKGTSGGSLERRKTRIVFQEREHRISPFPGTTFSDLKSSRSLTVRTPEEYLRRLAESVLLFLLSWWAALAAVLLRDRKVGHPSNAEMLPVLAFI
ncbi:MAG: serine/threonine-protein phosphatase, partial [Candidatus Methanomethylophilaceae archaeon]|nr:serine/threonine-protein phosphatase [Candidatus Methanomethylophilaceae archaeon]